MSPVQRQSCKVQNGYITELSRTGEWTWLTNSPRAKGHSPRVTGECNSRALYAPSEIGILEIYTQISIGKVL